MPQTGVRSFVRGLAIGGAGLCLLAAVARAQPDEAVQRKLEWFQDQKLGLLMHWGTYSQWGVVESWSLCPEDENWTIRRGPHAEDYWEYKQAYESLKTTFDPVAFHPEDWAAAAGRAGMRYVIFTTKHHDGFCMFDTKLTDYRITAPDCPFGANPRANVAKEIFDAFRAEGFGTGAYFSKPDWHCPDYWWPYRPPLDRNVNYDIARYPEKWEAFKAFTHGQVRELMSDYGPVDILWLDGGWVQPMTETSPRWGTLPCDQDIDMPKLAAMARELQPGLIVVDRAVEGPYQNYRTPEQEVPEKPLDGPWETCLTMGTSWSWVPNDEYKPVGRLVRLLVDVVAKGGNLLLNVGPDARGEWDADAYDRLAGLGRWMDVNGDALYGTRAVAPYKDGQVCYTRAADGAVNAIYLAEEGGSGLPAKVSVPAFAPAPGSEVRMLGVDRPLDWVSTGAGCTILVPDELRRKPPCEHAWAFRLTTVR